MKYWVITLFLITSCFHTAGQKAMSFDEAKGQEIRVSKLDSLYKSGVHSEPAQAVFNANAEEFIAAFQRLLQELGDYLFSHDFLWSKSTNGFNRIYFSESGKIEYFLYNFRAGQLSEEQEKKFNVLLNQFIADYQFPMKASVKFAQCSPVTYTPKTK